MRIEIVQFALPPGGQVTFSTPEFFGGNRISDILNDSSDFSNRTPTQFKATSNLFQGIDAIISGDFTYRGDEIFGTITGVKMRYLNEVFQDWRNLDWKISDISDVVDQFESGQKNAFDIFLEQFEFTFISRQSEQANFVMATDGDDKVIGRSVEPGDDLTVFTFKGDDDIDLRKVDGGSYVDAGAGNDVVRTGKGIDQIRDMDGGNDILKGGAGVDNIDGQKGRDKIYGQGGDDDFLAGGGGNDKIFGGSGNDFLSDNKGKKNLLSGGSGDDQLVGRGTLKGGSGNDELSGRGTLNGGTGNDKLSGKIQKSDVFDFRLGKADSFGNDRVDLYDYETFPDGVLGSFDTLLFDAGVDVSFVIKSQKDDIVATAQKDGAVIGTITFENVGLFGTSEDEVILNSLRADLSFV